MLIIKLLSGASFLGSIAWFIAEPGYEPVIAVITLLTALITVFIVEKRSTSNLHQRQVISGNGMGLQAGGDISVGNIGIKEKQHTDAK